MKTAAIIIAIGGIGIGVVGSIAGLVGLSLLLWSRIWRDRQHVGYLDRTEQWQKAMAALWGEGRPWE